MPPPKPLLPRLVLLLLTFGVFAPSLGNRFAMDDVPLVQAVDPAGRTNEIIVGWKAPWFYFGQRYWAGVDNNSVLYRPVTVWSFGLTYNLLSAHLPPAWEAFPHHLCNLLLHCLAVFLVWWMVRDLRGSELAALVTASVFGLHGLHSEVVAGIVGRAELFSFVFGLLATLLFARGSSWWAGLLFFLAFCSKESALAWAPFLPCYLLARHWLGAGDAAQAGVATVLAPRLPAMAAVLGLSLGAFFVLRAIAIAAVASEGSTFSYEQNPLAYVDSTSRCLTAVRLLGYGLVQCIAPFQLYCLYGPGAVKVVDSATDPGFILSFAVLAAWLGGGLGLCRRRPLLFLSVAAFLGFSFITSNIPMVIGTVYGERLFYLPSLGVCLVPAILLGRLGATGRRVLLGAVVAWAVTCGAVILARNGAWRDTETLFLTDAARLPQSADLQAKAGYVLIDADPERALQYFERSVAIDPEISGSWSSIGRIHQRRGDLDQAAANYKRALDTRFAATSGTESRTIEDYLMVLCAQQRLDEAVAFGREVLARMPEHYFARVAVLDHGSSRLPIGEWRRLLEDGMRLHGNDRVLILLAAMHGYESGQDLRQVLRGLQAGLAPPGPVILGPARQLRARLYLADVFGRLGQTAQALATYRDILGRAGLPTDLRQRIEASIRELTR